MHDGVDVAVADYLGDERIADVGADELGAAHPPQQVLARCDGVDGDDVVDRRVLREPGGQVSAKEPACAGDQHDLGVAQGAIVVPRVTAPGAVLRIHPVQPIDGALKLLAEFSALHPGATKQLAMLLLRHALTPLLDD